MARGEIETRDGLYLRFRAFSGEMLSLMGSGEYVPLAVTTPDYPSFSVADHGEPSRTGSIRVKVSELDRNVQAIQGRSDESEVELTCRAEGLDDAVRFSLRVADTSGDDRAVTLRFQIPVKAEGWSWWDDLSTARTISKGKRYVRYDRDTKGTFPLFWYPLGAISEGRERGLAFAVPMDPPTLARVGYDGDFFIEFDLGLSRATSKFPGRADLTFYLYGFHGEWGLRSAMKKYYDLFPKYFIRRTAREGLWLARTPTHKIEDPEDFGITFHQASSVMTDSVPLDNAMGLYTFLYDEPARVGVIIPFEKDQEEEVAARPSDEYVLAKLKEYAADPSLDEHASAVRVLDLASHKPDGNPYVYVEAWREVGWRCLFSSGPDPEVVVSESGETVLETWRKSQLPRILSLHCGRYDGQYIDSAEWLSDTVNCRKDHFTYADHSLGFHEATGTPGIYTGVTRFKYLKAVRRELLCAGKLMMANFTPIRCGFFATLLDVAGTEVWHRREERATESTGDSASETGPTVSEYDWRNLQAMYYRRAMMYQKPYCLLLQIPTAAKLREFGMERLVTYMNLCAFFAMYPGLGHGLDQAPDPYRDLYRKYMPVIRSLGLAGWEPVTHAATDEPSLRVERYGYWSQGTLHFAVRNFGDQQAEGRLTVDSAALRIGRSQKPRDAFTGREIESHEDGGSLSVPISLAPGGTAVIHMGCFTSAG